MNLEHLLRGHPSTSDGGESIPMTMQAQFEHLTPDQAAASDLFVVSDEAGMVRIPVSMNMMIPGEVLEPPPLLPHPMGIQQGPAPRDAPPGTVQGPSSRRFARYPGGTAAENIARSFRTEADLSEPGPTAAFRNLLRINSGG